MLEVWDRKGLGLMEKKTEECIEFTNVNGHPMVTIHEPGSIRRNSRGKLMASQKIEMTSDEAIMVMEQLQAKADLIRFRKDPWPAVTYLDDKPTYDSGTFAGPGVIRDGFMLCCPHAEGPPGEEGEPGQSLEGL